MLDAPGAGLAAPQIGVGLRVFTWHVDGEVGHLVNPGSTLSDEIQDGPEGCLSLPGLTYDCRGPSRWSRSGFNMYGDPVVIEGSELLARAIQHETDHLDGVLFIDRLDTDARKAAMKEIREAEWFGLDQPAVKVSPAPDERIRPVSRCASSSPARPRSPSPPSTRSSAAATSWSASSPAPTPRPAAAASWSPARSRSAPRSSA